jgi:hypothetical protein
MNVKAGQKVYLEPLGNLARRSSQIVQAVVDSVGRKYFTVKLYNTEYKFYLDSGVHHAGDYQPSYKAYESLQEIEDKRLANDIHSKIKKEFGGFKAHLPLSDLKQIADILNLEY